MASQVRSAKILVFLVVSMTAGALVLMALDRQSLSAGAFSLVSYTNLNPVEEVAASPLISEVQNWNRLEIFYSRTSSGNIDLLAKLSGLTGSEDLNFHFLVCNGSGGVDGQIQSTERWGRQRPALSGGNWYGTAQTIRICVIGNGPRKMPSSYQIKRTCALAELLSRKYGISARQISYPHNWQL